MPELRKDPISGRWVIIGTERVRRPSDFRAPRHPPRGDSCLLCAGRENETPTELLSYRDGAGGPWRVRVVPSKFPALRVEGELDRRGHGLYDVMNGIGAHEMIVESPHHHDTLATLPPGHVEDVIRAWHDRMVDLKRDQRFRSITIFQSHGADAGATVDHAHAQLLATPTPPQRLGDELHHARTYHDYRERCLFCDVLHQETDERTRVVVETEHMVAFAPYAARFPFEVWILPRRHVPTFENAGPTEHRDLARTLRTVLRKLDHALGDPPWTLVLHSAPFNEAESAWFHWHLEVTPRVRFTTALGWAGGFHVNPMPPEDAARFLRDTPD